MNPQPAWLKPQLYPFASKCVKVPGAQMHYIDEGKGDVLLFVHGTPSWSFDWRHIIKALSAHYRCVAIDHVGFGLSDKPVDYTYTTQQHAAILEGFITALNLKDITLVVHDFGGPVGLKYAIDHPDNIRKMVILNTWLWSSEGEPEFKKLAKILRSPLLPLLYKYFNFSARFLLPASFGNKKLLTKDVHRMYTKPFGKPSERLGTLGFAKSLLNDQQWFEGLWGNVDAICNKPTLFIWGMKDTFVTPKYLAKFEARFTNHTTLKLPAAGHFPQEEAGAEVVEAIEGFMK